MLAVVWMCSLPTMKLSAVFDFAAGEADADVVGLSTSGDCVVDCARAGPLSFSLVTCSVRMIKNCWFALAI